jgi:hypothetical protein
MILGCPSTNPVWHKYATKIQCAGTPARPPHSSVRMEPQDQLSFALGNPHTQPTQETLCCSAQRLYTLRR